MVNCFWNYVRAQGTIGDEVEDYYNDASRYNAALESWVWSFGDQTCSSYSISPQGKVSRRDQVDVDLLMQDHGNSLIKIEASRVRWCQAGFRTELDVWEFVLHGMRLALDTAIVDEDRFDIMIANARMEAFRPAFKACFNHVDHFLTGWSELPEGVATEESVDQMKKGIVVHLGELRAVGLWDGKWRSADDAGQADKVKDAALEQQKKK